MRQRRRDRAGVAAAIILALAAMPARPAELPPDLPAVQGVVGFREDAGAAYVAVRVDYPNSCALSGFLWYNNDNLVTYPTVRMGTGGGPGFGYCDGAAGAAG